MNTNMKQPKRLTLQTMFDTFNQQDMIPSRFLFKEGFGIVIEMNDFLKPFILSNQCPYLLEDYRMGIVKRGYIRGIINLQEYTIEAGNIVFITPGTIVEPIGISQDLQLTGMGIPADVFHLIHLGKLPNLFNGILKNGIMSVTENEGQLLDNMFRLLYEIAANSKTDDAVRNMVSTITAYYNELFVSQQPSTTSQRSTQKAMFDRFIDLVNKHCREQRHLSFYAERICVTERYLGTIVCQVSGVTAKEWIDKAVITAAKVMLRHTNKTVAEIADNLNFPNPSFFCKYFKRITGKTPQDYRF